VLTLVSREARVAQLPTTPGARKEWVFGGDERGEGLAKWEKRIGEAVMAGKIEEVVLAGARRAGADEPSFTRPQQGGLGEVRQWG
jgi:hypothetical protein